MLNKNYTIKENIEQYLGEEISSNIDMFIVSAQEVIDNYTRRNFLADKEDTERIYNGSGTNELLIDPAISIEKVEIDGVEKEFLTYPYNELPIHKIILRYDYFPVDYANITITGKFGYSECVPSDIKYCATVLASKMIKGNIAQDITAEKIGDYSVNYNGTSGDDTYKDLVKVKNILDSYKKLL